MADAIEAIGEKKKSVQDIMAQMQAQYLAMDAVSAGASVASVSAGNDEGLRIVKGGKKSGVMSANDESLPIDKPNLPVYVDVKGLMERVVLHLQAETDNAANELAQKKLEQNAAAFAKKHEAQLKNIDTQVAKSRGAEGESALTKAFRWIGVAAAMIAAVAASVASGGAATGLIIAAATALAAAIGEESGGFKAMEKAISKSLQENQGMTKKDADAAAGYISQAIVMAVQVAGDIAGGCLTTAPEKAAKTIVREGVKVAAKDTVSGMAFKTAKGMGEKATEAVTKATKEVAKDLQKAAKEVAEAGTKAANEVAADVQKVATETAEAGTKAEKLDMSKVVDDIVEKLNDKLVSAGGLTADEAKKVMDGVNKSDVVKLLETANKIAPAMKALNVMNIAVSIAQSGYGFSEQLKQDGKQRELRELDAVQQVVDAQQQQLLQSLSMENENIQKIQQRIQNMQDSIVQLAQSRENAAQEIVENMVSMV